MICKSMKKRRLFQNYVEFLLLCAVTFLLMKCYSRNIEGFAFMVVVFLSAAYVMAFLANLVLQNIFLAKSTKTGKRYFLAKIKLFAVVLLLVSVIPFIIFFQSDPIVLLLFFYVSILISYIIIIALFYHFDKKKSHSLNHNENFI